MAGNRLRNGLISLQRVLQGLNWRVAPVLALLLYLLLSQTRKVRSSGSVDVRLEHERRYSGFTGMDTFRSIEGRPYDMLYNTAVERPPNGSTAPLRDIIAVLLQRVEREPACAFVRMVHSALVGSPADVVLFHGSYPLRSDLHAIRAASPRRVDFVNVDGVFERYSADIRAVDPYLADPTFVKRSKWAYYNMIRFWFYDVFCVPMVASGVRYVLRLDDDSYFPRAPLGGADLFAQMSQRGAVYLWNEVQVDLPHVVLGLQNFTTAYVREHALEPRSGRPVAELFPRGSCYMYFNNFEVSSVAFFRSAPVRCWSEAVLLSGGLHRHRWGDAPLRYITMVSPSIHPQPHTCSPTPCRCRPCSPTARRCFLGRRWGSPIATLTIATRHGRRGWPTCAAGGPERSARARGRGSRGGVDFVPLYKTYTVPPFRRSALFRLASGSRANDSSCHSHI